MKIISPNVEVINFSWKENPLLEIEKIARTCYKSENNITENSSTNFVKTLLKHGHEAMIEHLTITVKIICDRGISHELVRHRIASYAQESTRYCNYNNEKFGYELTFIKPLFWGETDPKFHGWKWVMETLERKYFQFLAAGAKPEEVRSILPNSLKTEIIVSMNLREWRHFFKLRCVKQAHPQMREISIPMLFKFKELISIIFDDIEFDKEFESKYLKGDKNG